MAWLGLARHGMARGRDPVRATVEHRTFQEVCEAVSILIQTCVTVHAVFSRAEFSHKIVRNVGTYLCALTTVPSPGSPNAPGRNGLAKMNRNVHTSRAEFARQTVCA